MNLFIRKKAYIMMDRYDVLDDSGRLIYTIDGKMYYFKGRLTMRDRAGDEIVRIKKELNPFFARYTLEDPAEPEQSPVTVTQKFAAKPHFEMQLDGDCYTVLGNIRGCDYDIFNRDNAYALIRKRALRWGDTYILSIQDLREAPVFCALAVCIDTALFHKI